MCLMLEARSLINVSEFLLKIILKMFNHFCVQKD